MGGASKAEATSPDFLSLMASWPVESCSQTLLPVQSILSATSLAPAVLHRHHSYQTPSSFERHLGISTTGLTRKPKTCHVVAQHGNLSFEGFVDGRASNFVRGDLQIPLQEEQRPGVAAQGTRPVYCRCNQKSRLGRQILAKVPQALNL